MSSDPKPLRRSHRIAAKQAPVMSSTTAPVAVCKMTEAMNGVTVPLKTVSPQAPKMPHLDVRKHPHVDGVYLYNSKFASYMLSREEANRLGFWEFSEDEWDMIFLAEPKVSVATLCNEMTDQRYRYGGLGRAQRSALKVEKDKFGCYNVNEFSSTLRITRSEANALGVFPELSEEEWEWIILAAPDEAVEVRSICDLLTPNHCKEAKRRAPTEPTLDTDESIPPPPATTALTRQQAVVVEEPLLTPAMLKAETWGEPAPIRIRRQRMETGVDSDSNDSTFIIRRRRQRMETESDPALLTTEATAWIKAAAQRCRELPSSSGSIHAFLGRVGAVGDLLQFMLESVEFVEVLKKHKSGVKLAKACLQAACNLTSDERKVEQVRADLKYYRCPFYMRRNLDTGYKRIQDLVAIMRATVAPYINKHD